MKVIFCHNGPIKRDSEGKFYGVAHNDRTFSRYYDIADELQLLIRVKDLKDEERTANLSQITVSPLEVIEVPDLMSVKGMLTDTKKAKKIIYDAVRDADYVIARVPSAISYYAIAAAKKYNKPCLAEVVACPWDAYWNHGIKGKLLAHHMTSKMKKSVKDVPYALYVTNKFLQSRYPTNGIQVALSDVALNEISDKVLENRLSHIENNDGTIILGTTAAVNVRFKGQQYIIKALGELKKKGITNFRYEIVGTGDQSFLKKQIKDNNVEDLVTLKGGLPHDQVFEWLDSIDIYVQPSRQEGLPRALIEAMSRALPAFGARTGGIPELIDDKFIFSNTNKNIKEICDILMNFDKETIKEQAIKNFNTSKEYEKEVLNTRRKKFFAEFKKSL